MFVTDGVQVLVENKSTLSLTVTERPCLSSKFFFTLLSHRLYFLIRKKFLLFVLDSSRESSIYDNLTLHSEDLFLIFVLSRLLVFPFVT